MKRRDFLGLSVGGAVVALSSRARAQAPVKEIRIGYQKTGVLVIARQQAILEKHFAAKQIAIKWIEFTSGPPLLEAMSTGSVDLGAVGDTPPIFAQAANANIVYVAGSPITNGQGILVPANSTIRTIADLKGKRIGFAKGTSAHNVLIATLEKAGLTYEDITPVYLSPPDAGPGLRQWQHRGLGDLGSIFRDRREAAERPDPDQRLRGRQDQFVLSRQPRFREHQRSAHPRRHRGPGGSRPVGGSESRRGGKCARRGDRRAAGSPDRRGQPRFVRDRSGDGARSSRPSRPSPIASSSSA